MRIVVRSCTSMRLAYTALFVIGMLFGGARTTAQVKVIGYYPMWSKSGLPPALVKFNYLTHINHAFAWPLADGSITSYDAQLDTAIINATHRAGRKILISLGGAAESTNFPSIAADPALRHTFVQNTVSYLMANGYDGADIDWEGQSTVNPAMIASEIRLMREIKSAFVAEGKGWLLTMAIGAGAWSGQFHNFDSLKVSVDWFNLMSYDFHGSWSSHAGHNAPLYAPGWDAGDGSVDMAVQYLMITRHVPAVQIVLGVPFYGLEWTAAGLYQPFTQVTGVTYSTFLYNIAHNWVRMWDTLSQVPYLLPPSRTKVDTYDDSASVTLKCGYAKSRQLSGVMIWEITQDVVGQTQPLMDAIGLEMSKANGISTSRDPGLPRDDLLMQNYPNPFNPTTTIEFRLSGDEWVALKIFDLLGREVAVLQDGVVHAGRHRVLWVANGMASGVYLYRLQAGNFTRGGKMLLLK